MFGDDPTFLQNLSRASFIGIGELIGNAIREKSVQGLVDSINEASAEEALDLVITLAVEEDALQESLTQIQQLIIDSGGDLELVIPRISAELGLTGDPDDFFANRDEVFAAGEDLGLTQGTIFGLGSGADLGSVQLQELRTAFIKLKAAEIELALASDQAGSAIQEQTVNLAELKNAVEEVAE